MHTKSTWRAAVVLFMSINLTGCLVANNPVTTARHAEPNAVGIWTCTNDTNNAKFPMRLTISEDKDGLYKVEQSEYTQDGKARIESMKVFLSRGPHHNYVNMLYQAPPPADKPDAKPPTQYMIYEYEVAPDSLTVRAMGYPELAAAIQSTKLHGKAWETTWGVNAEITDESPQLLEFLESDAGQKVFTNEHLLTFARAKK